ncbi:MAG: lipoprotein, partial [Bacteroidales bacterium]|nr:lipoprotein [Bacteroidales bacterium]
MKRIIPLFLALALLASCSKDKTESLDVNMPASMLEKLSFENYKVETTKDKYGFHVFYEEGIDG